MRYVKFKARKRGIPNMDGGVRLCMHCNKKATVSAIKKSPGTTLVMDVWFCDEHALVAKGIGDK